LPQPPYLQKGDVPILGDANRLMRGCIPGYLYLEVIPGHITDQYSDRTHS
jgi:hypothetical protein